MLLSKLKTFSYFLNSLASGGRQHCNVGSVGQEAQAVGVAFDYRKLDEIDPSTRCEARCEESEECGG